MHHATRGFRPQIQFSQRYREYKLIEANGCHLEVTDMTS